MSAAYKKSVREAVHETDEPVSIRQLIGAKSILSADPAPAGAEFAAKSIKHDHGFHYLSAGRRDFENVPSLHFTIDGVQAAGDSNNVFVAWHPRKDLAGIPPIQVLWVISDFERVEFLQTPHVWV